MKKIMILILVFMIVGCESQQKEKQKAKNNQQMDTIIKPKEKWDVKKEYDELGNLIKFDSIYSYSYSNIDGDLMQVNLDSIMFSYKKHFENTYPFKGGEYFRFFPGNDSLFMNEFFKKDYFFKSWQKRHSDLEKMIKRMDSTRNSYLKKVYPGLIESKDRL